MYKRGSREAHRKLPKATVGEGERLAWGREGVDAPIFSTPPPNPPRHNTFQKMYKCSTGADTDI